MTPAKIAERVASLDWPSLHDQLDTRGFAQTPPLLDAGECRELAGLYETGTFRSTVNMGRVRYGEGEYKYFDHPLPETVRELRREFYRALVDAAARWASRLGEQVRYPAEHEEYLRTCHRAGQTRPTPLMLRYAEGDWNALHQDIYGELAFPFQIVTLLDRPGTDFEGGEFVLLEQRPRAQSRAHVQALRQGAFLIFTTRHRPVPRRRGGFYRAALRHGVSTLTAGQRTTLGVIFHDAA